MAKETVKKRKLSRIVLPILNVVLIVGLIAFGVVYFNKYTNLKNNPPSQQQIDDANLKRYIKEVSKLYSLPKNETPTFARVRDKDQLKSQAFFAKAENGDVALIYTNSSLAVLYRPSTKQIINVQAVTAQSSKPSVKVIGKQTDRQAVEGQIKSGFANDTNVVTGGDAKAEYSGIVVVDVSGKQADLAKKLADSLKGQVGTLPAGEDKPSGVDIVVIAGTTAP